MTVDLSISGAQDTGAGGRDILEGVEGILGTSFGDRLIGDAGDNLLTGGGGDDVLTGGGGRDVFLLATYPDVDTITDFTPGVDRIFGVGTMLGLTPGLLPDAMFRLGNRALDADDRVLYDPNTGALYFDLDGNGSGYDAVKVAQLGAHLAMSASDFVVI